MASPNYASLLDKPASLDDRPKTQPQGSYLCVLKGLPRYDKSSKKQTDFVEFTAQVQQANTHDVDQDDLEAWLTKSDGSKVKITDKTLKLTYYLTENSIFMLNDFLDHCGIDDADGTKSRRERIDETPNAEVVVFIRHEARQDGQGVQARVGKTAPAEGFNAAEAD